jgi:hypothetical protein
MADDFDAELAALRAVIDALTGVPSESRSRILTYAHQRFPAPTSIAAYQSQLAYAGQLSGAKGIG